MASKTVNDSPDVVLIGAGIMSATLGAFLKILNPNTSIKIYERLDRIAGESSDALNNAGTGHAALCELNYTPLKADGTVDTSKAINIMEQFELSKQFWAYLIEHGMLENPKDFIRSVPHMSFVTGDKDSDYLAKRYQALQKFQLFSDMTYTENHEELAKKIPLIMKNRPANQRVAATYSELGTDVDFGVLTEKIIRNLNKHDDVQLQLNSEVKNIKRNNDGTWQIKVRNLKNDSAEVVNAKFVFIGAGGGAINLLQKTGIPESKKYGGFPVGGQWLVCDNPEVVNQHHAKVYTQASVGAPPMSVPHLDTRVIDGKRSLLFGPFADFSTKFLKEGSFWDLFQSVKPWNIVPLMKVGLTNWDLEKYLIQQLSLSLEDRMNELRNFYPDAKSKDWKLVKAGQRVQLIVNDPNKGGTLQFGTELVSSQDGSIACLLGACPGASTSVYAMLEIIKRCFPEQFNSEWKSKINQMVPAYGISMESNPDMTKKLRKWSHNVLNLKDIYQD